MKPDYRIFWESAGGYVPAHWNFVPIADLLENPKSISVGVMYPGADSPGGVPLVRVSDVKDGAVAQCPEFCVSHEVDEEYKRSRFNGTELLITLVGNPGDCAIVSEEMAGWNAARALAVVRLKDPDLRPWLRYVLMSKPAKHLIDARLNTTVQKTLNLKDIKELAVPIPPQDERDRIAVIVGELEKKIVLNRQINQTLEQIAQTIFKSWFVDFEPVKAKIEAKAAGHDPERAAMCAISCKLEPEIDQLPPEQRQQLAATAALFTDELVESELGLIPVGWEWTSFGSVINLFDSKRIPLSKKERELRKGDFPYYGAAALMDHVDDYLFDGVHVLLAEDGSVMTTDGRPVTQYVWGRFWVNNHAHVLKGITPVSDEHILLFLKDINISPYINGAVQLKLNQKNMNSIPFLRASDAVLKCFSTTVAPLYDFYRKNSEQQGTLTTLRDVLLPKLLSGTLTVGECDRQVETCP
jgi:type I restriction enzyme S subunit